MKTYLPPKEVINEIIVSSKNKANNKILNLFILGFLAGIFISLAAHFYLVVSQGNYPLGIKKLLSGAVFSTGLILVLIPGSELWTGNNLMLIGYFSKTISLKSLLKNWVIVYFANFLGSISMAFLIIKLANFGNTNIGALTLKTAYLKLHTTNANHFITMISKGILCNLLVCLAVMISISATNTASKIIGIFFPITAFVASGFEHAIANMYFLPAALLSKNFNFAVLQSNLTNNSLKLITGINVLFNNILPVTIGNLIGGGFICAGLYWLIHKNSFK